MALGRKAPISMAISLPREVPTTAALATLRGHEIERVVEPFKSWRSSSRCRAGQAAPRR
jgi:hypothetical protein